MAIPIAPLVIAGADILSKLLFKPKQQQADTSYFDRYINRMKGDIAKKETYHTMMRGAMRNIGAVSEKSRRLADYDVAKYGNVGSGIDAARKLQIQQETNRAIGEASLQASAQQAQQDRQMRASIEEAEIMKARMLSQIKQQNIAQETQWQQGLGASIIGSAARVGGAMIQQGQQAAQVAAGAVEKSTGAFDIAKAAVPGLTREIFDTLHKESGITDPKIFAESYIKAQQPGEKPQYKVAYDIKTDVGYDVKWDEAKGEWQTLAGDQIDESLITWQKPEKLKEQPFEIPPDMENKLWNSKQILKVGLENNLPVSIITKLQNEFSNDQPLTALENYRALLVEMGYPEEEAKKIPSIKSAEYKEAQFKDLNATQKKLNYLVELKRVHEVNPSAFEEMLAGSEVLMSWFTPGSIQRIDDVNAQINVLIPYLQTLKTELKIDDFSQYKVTQ